MSTILGLDLGTNSIGWALRNTDLSNGPDQITHHGVVIFEKGVGVEKGVEFSRAAERTKNRAARKRNARRRWRKIDLLAQLIRNDMCPLSFEDLEQWKKPAARQRSYPSNELFRNWLRLDFDNDGVPDYENPFALRSEALKRGVSRMEFGRLVYHLNQRRGYLSNRSDKLQTADDDNGDIEKPAKKMQSKEGKVASAIRELESALDGKTIGQRLHEIIQAGGRARRRSDEATNIYRIRLQTEFLEIAAFQRISPVLIETLCKIIFDQRPLRSQKGTIGKCIYEKNKPRCPISHPEYELFRMWQVLNNIRYSDDNRQTWQPLDAADRATVQQKFFRRSSAAFEFADISKHFRKKYPNRIFNYKDTQILAGCPTLAGFLAIFGEEKLWQLRQQALERIEQEGCEKLSSQPKSLDLYDLWHWLFAMDNDKDQQIIHAKAQRLIGLSEKEADRFINIPIAQGYSSISLKAIRKINHWLEQGEKYDKAVFMANIPHILGRAAWEVYREQLSSAIQQAIAGISKIKNCTDIANSLIRHYNNLPHTHRFAGHTEYSLDSDDHNDVTQAILNYFGETRWSLFTPEERSEYEQLTIRLYHQSLAASTSNDLPYCKPPRLEEQIKLAITHVTGIHPDSRILNTLYHPSQIDSFLPALKEKDAGDGRPTGRLLLNRPATARVRNPMAMRALYELRKLVNYLLKQDLIDEHTHVIVELARELNDANRRKALERYQYERTMENLSYEQEILKLFQEQGWPLPNDLSTYVDRYRLREEQPRRVCLYTGRAISDADLFDEFTTDIEHTLPRSITFDDSLQNKTIAFKFYNNQIKDQLLPSQLPNYSQDTAQFTAIEPRLAEWEKRISDHELKMEISRKRSRVATTKEAKDKAIQDRHYHELHLRYWKSKLERFTITRVTEGFKNSQLVDTQLISKYGLQYLKTLFLNVRSTKGLITDKIKKIWGAIDADGAKDRSNHIHHSVDAIVQTLLHKERGKPDVYNLLIEGYREAEEKKWKEPMLPNPWALSPNAFHTVIRELTENTLVFHVDRDNVLKQTRKRIRDKGKIQYQRDSTGLIRTDSSGQKIPLFQQGRGIRASLHKDTFYGAIKQPVKENGKLKHDQTGRIVLQQDENGNDLIRYRVSFEFRGRTVDDIKKNLDKIVDDRLRELARQTGASSIHKQGYFEIPPSVARLKRDPAAQPNKVYKVKIFADNIQNPLQVKQHADVTKEHKRFYYAQTGGNYLMALYDNGREKDFELVNTYQLAGLAGERQGLYPLFKERTLKGKPVHIPLSRRNNKDVVLRQGIKVLLFEKSPDEITSNPSPQNLADRLFKVQGLSIQRQSIYEYGIVQLIHHMEARSISELKKPLDGNYRFGDGKKYRKLNHNQLKALVEGVDFHMTPAGAVIFIDNNK